METSLSLAAAKNREAVRRTTGRFGNQPHAESGFINPCPVGTSTRHPGAPVETILSDGTRIWTVDGALSRSDGPAVVHQDGTEESYRNGLRHCDTGPARVFIDQPGEFWLDGVEVTRSQFAWHQATRALQTA